MKKIKLLLIFIPLLLIFTSILSLKINLPTPSTIIYDSHDIEIGEIIQDEKTRHRPIKIEDIPEFTKQVIITLEDKSFYSNIWIDFKAIARSLYNNISSWKIVEWASTLSTQVIRNNFWLNKKRSYSRKISEFYLALILNTKYSKDEILENYLNRIYFWNLNYWIESASQYYFGKTLQNLTKAEQIALLIIPKNSSKYSPNKPSFRVRFEKVVNYLQDNWVLSANEARNILNEKLDFNYESNATLPYIVDYIQANKLEKESNIKTSIDYYLTKEIEKLALDTVSSLFWKDVWDYWVLVVDRKTNEIKIMIWWIDYYLENGQVNSTTALRQAWSTIKPFTYILAFQELWYKPSSTIIDLPIQFSTAEGNTYSPKNYSLDYKWEVTLAEALSQSINIPAVKLTNEIWLTRLYDFLKSLNFSTLNEDPEYYWLALTLGVWEMKLIELLEAYTIFAHEWSICKFTILSDSENICDHKIEKKYTDMVNEILTNRYFKLGWFPIHSNLDFPDRNVFVKTWTSRNFRDNWSIWFTDNYMIWVWVWNKDGTYMKWVSWTSWAGDIFRKIVYLLEKEDQDTNAIIYDSSELEYLDIISPLDGSIYKQGIIQQRNQVKLGFKTNINFNNYAWEVNWKLYDADFLDLEAWNHDIKISIFQNWKLIGSESSRIVVEE